MYSFLTYSHAVTKNLSSILDKNECNQNCESKLSYKEDEQYFSTGFVTTNRIMSNLFRIINNKNIISLQGMLLPIELCQIYLNINNSIYYLNIKMKLSC